MPGVDDLSTPGISLVYRRRTAVAWCWDATGIALTLIRRASLIADT
jgi:hypothetical protein